MTTAEQAIERAAAIGAEHGANAAAWWQQDAIGGRASGDTADVARRTLVGIEDGDPAVMDALPYADLSGEWADGMTPARLAEECDVAEECFPDDAPIPANDAMLEAICTAYEDSFNMAAQSAVESYCRAELEDDAS